MTEDTRWFVLGQLPRTVLRPYHSILRSGLFLFEHRGLVLPLCRFPNRLWGCRSSLCAVSFEEEV
jgi:hypothetical protein